jgi:hypothetical protein
MNLLILDLLAKNYFGPAAFTAALTPLSKVRIFLMNKSASLRAVAH